MANSHISVPELNRFQSLKALWNARHFLPAMGEEYQKRHGGVVSYFLGPEKRIFISDPLVAQSLLRLDYKTAVKPPMYQELRPYQGNGPVISQGDDWVKQRRWSAPFFLKAHYPTYLGIMDEEIEGTIRKWKKNTLGNAPINIVPDLNRLTFRILCRCVLGSVLDRYLDDLYVEINHSVYLLPKRIYSPIRSPLAFPLPTNIRLRNSSRRYRATIEAIIDSHKVANRHDSNGLLGHLFKQNDISRVEMVDMVATMVAAGFETTANLLSWVFALIADHQDVQSKLRTETETFHIDHGHDYLDAVINEALRLYPPVLNPARLIMKDVEVNGYSFKAGTVFDFGIWAIQRHPDYWAEPDQFKPERFLPENLNERSLQAFMPFAVGPRECSGKSFSLLESKMVVTKLIKLFQFRLAPGYVIKPEATIILRPTDGVHVTIAERHTKAYRFRTQNDQEYRPSVIA